MFVVVVVILVVIVGMVIIVVIGVVIAVLVVKYSCISCSSSLLETSCFIVGLAWSLFCSCYGSDMQLLR